ncbi:von Willebrand factor type A domain-containing protein [Gloeopeniophorella convolvens]|nr:von Willebrand factor type A domain-containing protein [Gloeopeniophorella convolvens]
MADQSSGDCVTILHHGPDDEIQHLPLQRVDVSARIIDVSAQVMLAHTFYNDSARPTRHAKYVFPIPASAAVCAFQMETSDDGLIVGVVKERDAAEAEYRAAVDTGKLSGLVKWAADDIFTMSVGSIPARTTVITRITCVMNLMDNATSDEIRFQLPMAVGTMRYGTSPPDILDAVSAPARTRLRINIDVQSVGELLSLGSPSHAADLKQFPYRTHRDKPSVRRRTVRVSSPSFLRRDFVLIVRSRGLDRPRVFAEIDATHGTTALVMSVVPTLIVPRIPVQDHLFLVDRSGSMQGPRIQAAQAGLRALLRALPSTGTTFNIFSFGTQCSSLWTQSQVYSQATLIDAIDHVGQMDANFGGTEIRSALMQVFAYRNVSMPTTVFLLTDGESHDTVDTLATVADAVNTALPSSPLRIFVLGIGDTASSAMCEGIAHTGRGVCLMALDSGEIVSKTAALVRAGIRQLVADVSVDWGTGTTGLVRQAPSTLGTLHQSRRFVAYALLHTPTPPTEVTLRGHVQDGAEVLSLQVPVRFAKSFSRGIEEHQPLHALVAHHLIWDLEHGGAVVPPKIGLQPEEALHAAIVDLGVRFHLASRFTSFVGIDEGARFQRERARARARREAQNGAGRGPGWGTYIVNGLIGVISRAAAYSGVSGPVSGPPHTGGSSPTRSRSRQPSPLEEGWGADDDFDEAEEATSDEDDYGTTPRRRRRPRRDGPRSPSPRVRHVDARPLQSSTSPDHHIGPEVEALLALQSFDGSFALDASLAKIVGVRAVAEAPHMTDDGSLWATVLAIAFLEKNLLGEQALLEGLIEKIKDSIQGRASDDQYESLIRRAREVVG